MIKRVTFSHDTKQKDGTSENLEIYGNLITGYFKRIIKDVEDVYNVTTEMDVIDFCIQETKDLIDRMLNNSEIKTYRSLDSCKPQNFVSKGMIYSKIHYPHGEVVMIKHKFPLCFNNTTNKLEIDWDNPLFKKSVSIISKGSRDIKMRITPKHLPYVNKFLKLLENAKKNITY